jgi:hypothetical protein
MRGAIGGRLSAVLGVVACVTLAAQPALAQAKGGAPIFNVGYTDIGPVIGNGGLGSASAAFGGRFEHAIQTLPSMGNGILGIEVGADYYSWSANSSFSNYSVKYIPIGVTANYHFKVTEPKLDPFVGLGLGYNVVSCSYSSAFTGSFSCGYNSGIYFIGRAGARYFFSPKMALYGDVGAGAATLSVGLMFKMH